jgi:hypothetical protein
MSASMPIKGQAHADPSYPKKTTRHAPCRCSSQCKACAHARRHDTPASRCRQPHWATRMRKARSSPGGNTWNVPRRWLSLRRSLYPHSERERRNTATLRARSSTGEGSPFAARVGSTITRSTYPESHFALVAELKKAGSRLGNSHLFGACANGVGPVSLRLLSRLHHLEAGPCARQIRLAPI